MAQQGTKNIFVTVFTFLFSSMLSAFSVFAQANYNITPVVVIDFFGVAVGAISVVIVYSALRNIGGAFGQTFKLILFGITFQVIAIIYTLIFARFKLYAIPGGIDIHHLLMIIGLVIFVLAARNLTKLSKMK